jgi:hypothetical protein
LADKFGMPALSSVGSVNGDAVSSKVAIKASPLHQSEPTTTTSKLSRVCFLRNSLQSMMIVAIDCFLFDIFPENY